MRAAVGNHLNNDLLNVNLIVFVSTPTSTAVADFVASIRDRCSGLPALICCRRIEVLSHTRTQSE